MSCVVLTAPSHSKTVSFERRSRMRVPLSFSRIRAPAAVNMSIMRARMRSPGTYSSNSVRDVAWEIVSGARRAGLRSPDAYSTYPRVVMSAQTAARR